MWERRAARSGLGANRPMSSTYPTHQCCQYVFDKEAHLRIVLEEATVPVLVDAGVGTASDATIAMELGCAGVLMNSAIAHADQPVLMAQAMHHAVLAGRGAYLAGRMPRKLYATASSPLDGTIR